MPPCKGHGRRQNGKWKHRVTTSGCSKSLFIVVGFVWWPSKAFQAHYVITEQYTGKPSVNVQDKQRMFHVTLGSVRATFLAVEKQYILHSNESTS